MRLRQGSQKGAVGLGLAGADYERKWRGAEGGLQPGLVLSPDHSIVEPSICLVSNLNSIWTYPFDATERCGTVKRETLNRLANLKFFKFHSTEFSLSFSVRG